MPSRNQQGLGFHLKTGREGSVSKTTWLKGLVSCSLVAKATLSSLTCRCVHRTAHHLAACFSKASKGARKREQVRISGNLSMEAASLVTTALFYWLAARHTCRSGPQSRGGDYIKACITQGRYRSLGAILESVRPPHTHI